MRTGLDLPACPSGRNYQTQESLNSHKRINSDGLRVAVFHRDKGPELAESVSTDCLRGTASYAALPSYRHRQGTTGIRPKVLV